MPEFNKEIELDSFLRTEPTWKEGSTKISMQPKSNTQIEVELAQEKFMSRPEMRTFMTGATRSQNADKLDYEGFLSPLVLERFAQYLHHHRIQTDGKVRASDNWQKGIPINEYMSSLLRHCIDTWKRHDGYYTLEDLETNLCGVIFNANGYLFEIIKARLATKETA
jgi:hypothetical protein